MSRDVTKLRVFQESDRLVRDVYRISRGLPPDERFGLQAQLRRAAISVPANLIEGSARRTTRHFLSFVETSLGSAMETNYLLRLCVGLEFLTAPAVQNLETCYRRVIGGLQNLLTSLEPAADAESDSPRRRTSSKRQPNRAGRTT